MINRYTLFAGLWLALASLASCSSEDELSPSNSDTNGFVPTVTDHSAEASLRQQFFNTYGSYLLFTDTLSDNSLLNLGYVTTTQTEPVVYGYEYLPSLEKRQEAANFVIAEVIPHLGKSLRPFSFFLVSQMTRYTQSGTSYIMDYSNPNPVVVIGTRSTAIALQAINEADDATRQTIVKQILSGIVVTFINGQTGEAVDNFTADVNRLYGQSIPNVDYNTITEKSNMQMLNEAGFIAQALSSGFPVVGQYPSRQVDMESYARLAIEKTEDEVKAAYAQYPFIVERYNLMKAVLKEIGYVE